jgi:hypothetical protein
MGRDCHPRAAWLLLAATALARTGLAGPPPAAALTAFDAHIRATESRIDGLLQNRDAFLWADTDARRLKLRAGDVICVPQLGKSGAKAPNSLIHDWVGAIYIPHVSVRRVLELVQDYDNHKNTYRPNVIASRTLKRSGNDFTVSLRLLERRFGVMVVLDTEYDVRYSPLSSGDWRSRSYSTRIVEIAKAGSEREREKTPREDRGYLWRLYSYWLFRERDGGTYVECEAISLSRGIPVVARLVDPVFRRIIRELPKRFLTNTLRTTRDALLESQPQARH